MVDYNSYLGKTWISRPRNLLGENRISRLYQVHPLAGSRLDSPDPRARNDSLHLRVCKYTADRVLL